MQPAMHFHYKHEHHAQHDMHLKVEWPYARHWNSGLWVIRALIGAYPELSVVLLWAESALLEHTQGLDLHTFTTDTAQKSPTRVSGRDKLSLAQQSRAQYGMGQTHSKSMHCPHLLPGQIVGVDIRDVLLVNVVCLLLRAQDALRNELTMRGRKESVCPRSLYVRLHNL